MIRVVHQTLEHTMVVHFADSDVIRKSTEHLSFIKLKNVMSTAHLGRTGEKQRNSLHNKKLKNDNMKT